MKPSLGASLLGLISPVHFGNFAGWWSRAVWFALGARERLCGLERIESLGPGGAQTNAVGARSAV